MLDESSGRMRHAGRFGAAQLGRQPGHGFVEAQMRPASAQKVQDMIPKIAIAVHGSFLKGKTTDLDWKGSGS
jgi:hypothetical protein